MSARYLEDAALPTTRETTGRLFGFPLVHPIFALVLLPLLAGCAFNTQQRPERGEVPGPAPKEIPTSAFSEKYAKHRTAYIEFDEQGDFWDRRQLGDAIRGLRASRRPVILVVYAHGWQNHSQSADVERFNQQLLARLADSPLVENRYDVYGTYLGWNGKLLHGRTRSPLWKATEVGTPFTFWGRKNAAAHRMAGTSATEAIFSLARAARLHHPRSKVVVIGHSFGALVMERSVAQALTGALLAQTANSGNRAVTPPMDLVVLMNSAAESIYAKQLIDFFRANPQPRGSRPSDIGPDRPLVVSITSRADWATGWAFRVGTSLSNLFGSFREYDTASGNSYGQRQFLTHTATHVDRLLSHEIEPTSGETPRLEWDSAFDNNLMERHGRQFATQEKSNATPEWWWIDDLENPNNRTPYWVVGVPREISAGHTDVWNNRMSDLLAALFALTQREPGTAAMSAQPRSMMLMSTPMAPDAPGSAADP